MAKWLTVRGLYSQFDRKKKVGEKTFTRIANKFSIAKINEFLE
jgi:hypothetical protein